MKKAYLVLSNGKVFEGESFGARRDSVGELVFTTEMNGYIETLSDPCYYGQIILQTFPLIGNYGIIEEDLEGECAAAGYVVREWCSAPSNFRSLYDIDTYLKDKGVAGISGVDTREITKIIREQGTVNAKICQKIPDDLAEIQDFKVTNAVKAVSQNNGRVFPSFVDEKFKVALVDYGAKRSIVSELQKRGCAVAEMSSAAAAEEILSCRPDGIVLSDGPGDPAENTGCVDELKKLFGKAPIFGIGLGHQLLALANGWDTVKLKYGHRGSNQPVRDLLGTRTYITTQNHGYTVVPKKSGHIGTIRYVNANDGTCEGIDYDGRGAFSVQFHPKTELSFGRLDSPMLFDRFINVMGEGI